MRLKNIHVPPNLIPLEKKRRQKKRQKADYKKREGERVTEKEEWRRGEARRMEAIVVGLCSVRLFKIICLCHSLICILEFCCSSLLPHSSPE